MPAFQYKALDKTGAQREGTVEAADKQTALAKLHENKLKPLVVTEASAKKELGLGLFKGKVKSDDLVIFTRELSAMISAGVPLLRAINSLEEHADSPPLKKVLGAIQNDIQGGAPLADALEKHSGTFNDVYVNMVRAGEAAGILDDILKRLALQQEKSSTMRKKIKSAMTYPMVLIVISILAFFGLMLFVIPQIGKIIKDLGGEDAELPALTQAMLGISAAITGYWYIVLPLMGLGVYGVLRYIKTPKGKRQFHGLILKMPGIKTIIQKVAIARFSRTYSSLIGAGVAVLEALSVTAKAVGNKLYEEALLNAAEAVENGATLSSIIEKNPLFPAIVAQMLSVGEETGQTDQVLVKVAEFYEEEVDVAIEGISSIIEPVMIVFMGGMVGVIAASVMMPIASLSQNIK